MQKNAIIAKQKLIGPNFLRRFLFNNGKEAAEKVNEICGDVEGWWRQSHIQKAREEWCWQYARTSKNWRWEWIKAIWKL